MSEWPVVVARPLTTDEAACMAKALRREYLQQLGHSVTGAGAPVRTLVDALTEGRICIEQEEEPSDEEVAFHDRHVINDDAWEAAKEGRL